MTSPILELMIYIALRQYPVDFEVPGVSDIVAKLYKS